ncbi:iron transporter [Caulobacter sp. D4A]|uniref:FeoA family protein n=1 Tax=unclassified Caulobacter TaxID=2648921 RepID=UPI000D72DFDA|nr:MULTISPECIES: FeoA family protein [unclassified Caulobacter]PXA89802.1 iron transporter [Caulobacter sp. D4A]PXA92556.1 iron transporter [Caulobacter sp. D5]
MTDAVLTADASIASDAPTRALSTAARGDKGVIVAVRGETGSPEAVAAEELERRLLEMGFVEGARIEILQEGLFGRDPIAVRVDDTRVALRRREARAVTVQFDGKTL